MSQPVVQTLSKRTCYSDASGASCSCPPGTGRPGCSPPASRHPAPRDVCSGLSPSSLSCPLALGQINLESEQ